MQRLAFQCRLPCHPAELHPPEIAAATVVDDIKYNLLFNLRSCRRLLQPAQKCRRATCARPRRHKDGDARVRRCVRVLVHHYVDALPARGIHQCKRLAAPAPHRLADDLVMRQHNWQLCLAANLDGFLHRVNQPQSFLAEVRGIKTAACCCLPRQRNDLVRLGKRPGQILQSRRNSPSPLVHCLPHHRLHSSQFLCRWRTVVQRHHCTPDRVVPHQQTHV